MTESKKTEGLNAELPPSETKSLMQFPMEFPIKIMGIATEDFLDIVHGIAREHFEDFSEEFTKTEYSRTGKYMSVTITVNAQSKDQLDNVYRTYTSHPKVKIVL